ncbi:MAG TPA: pirin family protein [Mycobacteriales bacterium]|jgi:redox-sensitive bicupin YhaK (pirin superfamily)|nr:pirin family protein [Mycobacteriales bacterium]
MSGPVTTTDAPAVADNGHVDSSCVEVSDSHEAVVGRLTVRRALPRRGRRTVGAWCFADHMGPADVTENSGLDVGPHPHMGLQTVTWLLDGEALHRDSLGSEQLIAPGQLNLMTAGAGVAHAEEATGTYSGRLHGIQLWVAQPDATRHGGPAFEHHDELPQLDLGDGAATVLIGELGSVASPARRDTELVGVDVSAGAGGDVVLPARRDFEHALVVLEGAVTIGGTTLTPGHLGYLGRDRDEIPLHAEERSRALLLGGVPFPQPILMFWNFVARDRAEMETAWRDWNDDTGRFGRVASSLPRIPSPEPYWLTG